MCTEGGCHHDYEIGFLYCRLPLSQALPSPSTLAQPSQAHSSLHKPSYPTVSPGVEVEVWGWGEVAGRLRLSICRLWVQVQHMQPPPRRSRLAWTAH